MKWINEKENLDFLINQEHVSYEEIGRRYDCTGAAVKKAAKRLGINIPERRKINPKETFQRGTAKKGICKIVEKSLFYIQVVKVYFALQNVFTNISIKKLINLF